jgi:hypothetical protein
MNHGGKGIKGKDGAGAPYLLHTPRLLLLYLLVIEDFF